MSIYGKNTYVLDGHNYRKNKEKKRRASYTATSQRQRANEAMDRKYGKAVTCQCNRCGKPIYLIRQRKHERTPNQFGIHDKHTCKASKEVDS